MAPVKPSAVSVAHTSRKLSVAGSLLADNVKRKADKPLLRNLAGKRSALGDVTNDAKAATLKALKALKKDAPRAENLPKKASSLEENLPKKTLRKAPAVAVVAPRKAAPLAGAAHEKAPLAGAAPQKALSLANETQKVVARLKRLPSLKNATLKENQPKQPPARLTRSSSLKQQQQSEARLSTDSDTTEDESFYSTALEEANDSLVITKDRLKSNSSCAPAISIKQEIEKLPPLNLQPDEKKASTERKVPSDVFDFDKENWSDIFQVSHYAVDIFKYLKEREAKFVMKDYMKKQPSLTEQMRCLLVDWMVEVQESFELNHETLYLSVKLTDVLLSKMVINRKSLQLVGASALMVACKFEERLPPLVSDFIELCAEAYTRRELLKMEQHILRSCDFELGIPLSYRFLRRYARCNNASMVILTLARYILETSLMSYSTVVMLDSKLAAASLYIAQKMSKLPGWNKTLCHFTGYDVQDFIDIAIKLNDYMHKDRSVETIQRKYSHKVFHEVAKTPLLTNEELLKN